MEKWGTDDLPLHQQYLRDMIDLGILEEKVASAGSEILVVPGQEKSDERDCLKRLFWEPESFFIGLIHKQPDDRTNRMLMHMELK